MKRLLLALGFIGALGGSAAPQTPPTVHPCYGSPCVGVSTTNPLPTTGTFTPSGTQNVNLTQILSAPPSLTNPLWVFPATGASFAVTGTFFQATQPVSGTVTANQGTPGSAWPVTLASTAITGNTVVIGPTADGSPATTAPVLIAGTADGSASGNVSVAKVDAAGLVYAAITNWGGTALGAMANYGTSPGAVLVPGVNAFITNTVTVSNGGTFVVQDTNVALQQAPVAPATATATKSALAGCQATSAAINPTTGQQAAVDCDLNNNLLVSAGGAPNLATSQASVTTGNISVASARALRRAITITNITGTGAAFCGNTGVTTSTGTYLGATAGSSITLNTTAAVFCTVAATTQTVAVAETY